MYVLIYTYLNSRVYFTGPVSSCPFRRFRGRWMCHRCMTGDDLADNGENTSKRCEHADIKRPHNVEQTLVSQSAPNTADFVYQPYLTRHTVSSLVVTPQAPQIKNPKTSTDDNPTPELKNHSVQEALSSQTFLKSYGPSRQQLDSFTFTSTYYDLPGHAPRWANHTHADYPGTWLAQNVRWSLLRYTRPNDRVLSTFLGRGTDVIEACLMGRQSVGIDINSQAIALAQRNCSFIVPRILKKYVPMEKYKPRLLLEDARYLVSCQDASFDIILSHPPYHHAIIYSAGLEGDLSRFPSLEEFGDNMTHVAKASFRVLKEKKRCIVCVGDNREHCYLMPVCFVTFRSYLNAGFIMEEFIARRQRFCSRGGKRCYVEPYV